MNVLDIFKREIDVSGFLGDVIELDLTVGIEKESEE